MIKSFEDPKIIDALFFIILGILGEYITYNFAGENIVNKIKKNDYYKYSLLFIIIYFTNTHIQNKNIKDTFVNSIVLFIMLFLILKNNFRVIILIVVLFSLHKLISQYIKELDQNKKKEQIKELTNINYYILHIVMILIVLGFFYKNYYLIKF
jgi:hypothetical protein